jgi:hypothetical protein
MRFGVRVIRAGVGVLLLLLAVPLMMAGGGLWLAGQHRASDGTFSARLERVKAPGRAVVVTDVDALLRADAPFARGGQTTLSVSARGPGGLLFLGLAPYDRIEQYLAGVPQTRVRQVRLARGTLPVDVADYVGELTPRQAPTAEPFWVATSSGLIRDGRVEDALTWSPATVRGHRLGLVVMNADGSPGVDVSIVARLRPTWLAPTERGVLALGGALVLLALLILAWPTPPRASAPREAAPMAGPPALDTLPNPPTAPPLPVFVELPVPPVKVRLHASTSS